LVSERHAGEAWRTSSPPGTGCTRSGRTTEGIYARIAQRLLAMAACIWHNRASDEPVKRPLTAFDN
jgi:hypothetical protein